MYICYPPFLHLPSPKIQDTAAATCRLVKFETKYDNNFNLETINERSFNKFNKFYRFTKNEILSILEQECKLFESILDQVDPKFLVMHIPFFQHDNILYQLCKSRGIKCLLLRTSRLSPLKCLILEDNETSNELDKLMILSRGVGWSNWDLEIESSLLEGIIYSVYFSNFDEAITKSQYIK